MSRTSLEVKAKRKPKFSARAYNRCPICGRSRAFLRQFGVCRICFRSLALKGELPGVRSFSGPPQGGPGRAPHARGKWRHGAVNPAPQPLRSFPC